jgi:hypothetical protein
MALITILITVLSVGHFDVSLDTFDLWTIMAGAKSLTAAAPKQCLLAAASVKPDANLQSAAVSNANSPADSNSKSIVKQDGKPSKKSEVRALAMHALCADILSTYVNDKGLVDYKTLRRKRLALIGVLGEYAKLDPNEYRSWTDSDKLAFWINAHNMCIIKAVIDNYPIQPSRFKVIFYPPNSVMQVSDFWDKAAYRIMGENYSLNEIENKIIRGQFSEPRVCFAISYASLGCAPLRREPYYGRNLGEQLDEQAANYLASDKGMTIDRDQGIVGLSAIFEWYGKEFAAKYAPDSQFSDKPGPQASELTYIMKHIPRKDSDWLLRKNFSIRYIRYDWTLNEQ